MPKVSVFNLVRRLKAEKIHSEGDVYWYMKRHGLVGINVNSDIKKIMRELKK